MILFTCFHETKYLFKMYDSQRMFFTKRFPYFVSGRTKHGYFILSEWFVQRGHQEGALNTSKGQPSTKSQKKNCCRLFSYWIQSPSTRQSLQRCGYVNSPEKEEDVQVASSILQETTAALQTTKRKLSNDARAATQVSLSYLCAEKVSSRRVVCGVHLKIEKGDNICNSTK